MLAGLSVTEREAGQEMACAVAGKTQRHRVIKRTRADMERMNLRMEFPLEWICSLDGPGKLWSGRECDSMLQKSVKKEVSGRDGLLDRWPRTLLEKFGR